MQVLWHLRFTNYITKNKKRFKTIKKTIRLGILIKILKFTMYATKNPKIICIHQYHVYFI